MTRTRAVLIWLDQGLTAFILKSPDETFSSASYRIARTGNRKWQRIERAIDTLFFWESEHCRKSYHNELIRAHMPVDYK